MPTKCKFFQWIDDPVDEAIKALFAHQEKKIKNLASDVGRLEADIRILEADIRRSEADIVQLKINYSKMKKYHMFVFIYFVTTIIALLSVKVNVV